MKFSNFIVSVRGFRIQIDGNCAVREPLRGFAFLYDDGDDRNAEKDADTGTETEITYVAGL